MMREPVRLVAPTETAVSIETLKSHVKEDSNDNDALLALYLAAATEHVERHIGRAIFTQEWQLVLDAFPAGDLILPIGPVQSIDLISYIDADEAVTTLEPVDYGVDTASVEARVRSVDGWPDTADTLNTVTVEWTAGGTECPPDLQVAIMLLAGNMFENREAVVTGVTAVDLPFGVKQLLAPHRRFKG
jgi:uncharacterized phiE125 gp8 family phage protein